MAKKQKNNEPKSDLSPAQYEKVGRMFIDITQSAYANRWRIFYLSFVKGFFSGIGGIIGATVGVALLLYILSFFDTIPLIDRFIDLIESSTTTTP